jgi:hypothetical protein
MRPLFSIWSDYRTPSRKYRMSALGRGDRPSVCRKIFLTAVMVAAAVIGIRELYGQAVDKRGLEPAVHAQSPITPSANPTGRRFASVAAIPLSPQPVLSTNTAATDTPPAVSPASVPALEPPADPVVASKVAGDHAIPPALAAIPTAQAGALPRPPAAVLAMKFADGPRGAEARKPARVAHRTRSEGRGIGGYAEAIAARFGHSRELRAALQMFL